MAINPFQEYSPKHFFQTRLFIHECGISPEPNRYFFMKVPQAFQMTFKTPTKYEDGSWLPGFYFGDQPRIDNAFEMMSAGIRRDILHKTMIITFEQWNIPIYFFPETRIVLCAGFGLAPGIK